MMFSKPGNREMRDSHSITIHQLISLMILTAAIAASQTNAIAQGHGFKYGALTYREFDPNFYKTDTSATALVLNEFGEAWVDDEGELVFEYHSRIKVLKKGGEAFADIAIELYHNGQHAQRLHAVKASSFNVENGSIKETAFDAKRIFNARIDDNWEKRTFAIPNVRVGSIIELQYTISSPYLYNFRDWEFQSTIPKMYSEYWASIPANLTFNMTIRGYLKLLKNEGSIVKDGFSMNGNVADCALYKWAIKDIPAFRKEDFMTASSNYLSMIKFELSEIKSFDGGTKKVTKEWKDVEQEFRLHQKFGVQLKRGKSIVDEHVGLLVSGEKEQLASARKVYEFIKGRFKWNEEYSMYSDLGVKEAFDKKTGNVADINLSLIASLRYAGIDTEPVLLSTRAHGIATEIHPVMSEFNYVIAKVNIDGKSYLLDATDVNMPFGMIPERCLNGKGRVLGEKESYWYELKPSDKARTLTLMNARLDNDGVLTGSVQMSYYGYEAINERSRISDARSLEDYAKSIAWDGMDVTAFKIENQQDLDRPLICDLTFRMTNPNNPAPGQVLFNPIGKDRWEKNPFKASERIYPVDFAKPIEEMVVVNLEYPEGMSLADLPKPVALALPNNGGKFIYDVKTIGNRLTVTNRLLINRTFFTPEEYHYLKELFGTIVSVHQNELYFTKR